MNRIDLEAHYYTHEYAQYLLTRKEPPRDELKGQSVIRWLSPDFPMRISPAVEAMLQELGQERIEEMNTAGVKIQVLSLTVPGCEQFEPSEGAAVAKKANNQLAEAIGKYPGRFIGLAALAPQDPPGAAEELARAVNELGLMGAIVHSHIGDGYLDDKKYWCIFEKAESLDVPIYIHPTIPSPSMLKPYAEYGIALAGPPLGFGADTALHVMRLIYSGVFDVYPKLKIILGHLGEALPFWLDRIDFFWKRPVQDGKFVPRNTRKPSEYIKNNFFVTTSGMPFMPAFIATYLALGAERILFATDFPYENSTQAAKSTEAMPICDADKEKIFHLNAERLFKLRR